MKKLSKIFAVVLVLAMVLSVLPLGAAAASNWTEVTDLSTLAATDKIAIVSVKGSQSYAMMSNADKGVLVAFNAASTAGNDTMLWNVAKVSGGFKFLPAGVTNEWLYCTNTNNGLMIGNTTQGSVWSKNGNLYKATDNGNNERNMCIYYDDSGVAKNFRCYKTSNTTNPAGQTIKFYKWSGGAIADTRENLPTTSGAIVDAIFKLAKDETLSKYYKYDGKVTLTGVVSGDAVWSDKYNNGEVNFKVKDSTGAEKTMKAYKLVAGTNTTVDDIKGLKTGDIITISGAVIKNYGGSTFEYDGCELVSVEKGQVTLPNLPTAATDITSAIYALKNGEDLSAYYKFQSFTLSGTIVGDVTWNEQYGDGQLTFKVDGTDKELMAYQFKAGSIDVDVVKALAAGDKVTFSATAAKNYNGTYEIVKPVLTAVEKATNNDDTNNDNTEVQPPKPTGDNTAIVAMTSVMAVAVVALAVLVIGKKRMF